MSPQNYLKALKKLKLTVASPATAEALGVTVRQSYRFASGENKISPTIAKLLACLLAKRR